jgi:hypothetical protein
VHAEIFAQDRVVGLARLAADMSDIFGEGKAEHGQHAFQWVLMVVNRNKKVGSVEVMPVFEVGYGL